MRQLWFLLFVCSLAGEATAQSRLLLVTEDRDIALGSEADRLHLIVIGSPSVYVFTDDGADVVEVTWLFGRPRLSVFGGDGLDTISTAFFWCSNGSAILDVDDGPGAEKVRVQNTFSEVRTTVYINADDPEPSVRNIASPRSSVEVQRYTP